MVNLMYLKSIHYCTIFLSFLIVTGTTGWDASEDAAIVCGIKMANAKAIISMSFFMMLDFKKLFKKQR